MRFGLTWTDARRGVWGLFLGGGLAAAAMVSWLWAMTQFWMTGDTVPVVSRASPSGGWLKSLGFQSSAPRANAEVRRVPSLPNGANAILVDGRPEPLWRRVQPVVLHEPLVGASQKRGRGHKPRVQGNRVASSETSRGNRGNEPGAFASRWRAVWDARNLYLLVEVLDWLTPLSKNNEAPLDRVELKVKGCRDADCRLPLAPAVVVAAGRPSSDNENAPNVVRQQLGNGLRYATSSTGGAYVVEVAIPWKLVTNKTTLNPTGGPAGAQGDA